MKTDEMKSDEADSPRHFALQYLVHLEELTAEIRAGMDAVGANTLFAFEQSVSKQQQICMNLRQLKEQADREGISPLYQEPQDHRLAEKIRTAAELLRTLNTQYAALLKHSGDSVQLFAGLCRGYAGPLVRPNGLSAQRLSRSWELWS